MNIEYTSLIPVAIVMMALTAIVLHTGAVLMFGDPQASIPGSGGIVPHPGDVIWKTSGHGGLYRIISVDTAEGKFTGQPLVDYKIIRTGAPLADIAFDEARVVHESILMGLAT